MKNEVKSYILETFRVRYHQGSKAIKGGILDEVCERFGCHRKHAIRLMRPRSVGRPAARRKPGRKSKYDTPEFLRALHRVRRAMEFRNTEVMKGNMV